MHNYANHGYVVKAMALAPLLRTDEDRNEFREMIEIGEDSEDIGEFFVKNMRSGFPAPIFFTLNDDDEAIDMDLNELYAEFVQSDLFVLVKTPKHNKLNCFGVIPELKQWVTWG